MAEPAVRLVLGPQWVGAVPLVKWISLSLIPALFTLPTVPLLMSFGKTRTILCRNGLELSVKLPLALMGTIIFGVAGLIAARFMSETVADIYCLLIVRRLTGLSIAQQVLAPWRPIVAAGLMALSVTLSMQWVGGGSNIWDASASLTAAACVGGTTYAIACWALWRLAGQSSRI